MEELKARISVNSSCNLDCHFCHRDGNPDIEKKLPRGDALLVAKLCRDEGIENLQLTGGEPLIRDDLPGVLKDTKRIHPSCDLSLFTNGINLSERADELKGAGIDKIKISIPSLQKERYRKICGAEGLERVLEGLERAKRLGLGKIEINVVLEQRNFEEVESFVDFASKNNYDLQFREIVPAKTAVDSKIVPWQEIKERMKEVFDGKKEVKEGHITCNPAKDTTVKAKKSDLLEREYLRLTVDSRLKSDLLGKDSIELRDGGLPKDNFRFSLQNFED